MRCGSFVFIIYQYTALMVFKSICPLHQSDLLNSAATGGTWAVCSTSRGASTRVA